MQDRVAWSLTTRHPPSSRIRPECVGPRRTATTTLISGTLQSLKGTKQSKGEKKTTLQHKAKPPKKMKKQPTTLQHRATTMH
jgi:hypothetical protein